MTRLRMPHYAWIVAIVAFMTMLVAAGIRATPGLLMVPLETEFGWPRTIISFAVGLNILLYGATGPFAAALMNRFGVRNMMLFALSMMGTGVALTPFMQQSWHMVLLWGVVVGMGAADVDPQWAEHICLGLVGHVDETVRGNAILGLGHIARTCRRLDVARVAPKIRAALADPSEYVRGQAEAAAGDLEVFLGMDVRRAGAVT